MCDDHIKFRQGALRAKYTSIRSLLIQRCEQNRQAALAAQLAAEKEALAAKAAQEAQAAREARGGRQARPVR